MIKNLNFILCLFLASILSRESYGNSTETYTYNEHGKVVTIDGPRVDVNDITEYEYYENGDLKEVKNALGHTTHYSEYDAYGNPGRIISPNGVATELLYDLMGRLISKKIINPDNVGDVNETSYVYDETGLLTKILLPNGSELSYQYDAFSRLAAISNDNGERVEYIRDSAGNKSGEVLRSPDGQVKFQVGYVYDELRQLRNVLNASGDMVTHEYDLRGNIISTTDGRSHTTVKIYDELGRLTKLIDPALHETQISYDRNDNVSSVIDANGNLTAYTYDAYGNLTIQSSPVTGVTTHDYDPAHNRIQTTDSRGVKVEYIYDALNRLLEEKYIGNPNDNVTYSYDGIANGNYGIGYLTAINTPGQDIEYVYNYLGLVIEKRTTIGSDLTVVRYEYDSAGQLSGIIYPSGREVRYTHDSIGRIEQVFTKKENTSTEESVVSNLTYLPFGGVKGFTFGNGLIHAITYDQNYRTTGIKLGQNNPILERYYEYDAANNISTITNSIEYFKNQQFTYDSLDRIIHADGQYGLIDYSYDPVGNRLSQRRQFSGEDIVETYIYDINSNQLLYVDQNTNGFPSQSREFAYDTVGNRLEGHGEDGSAHHYQYNAANRLTSVGVGEAPAITYVYNPLGQRIQKVKADGSKERYHYNESHQLLSVSDENGDILREYIYLDSQQIAFVTRAPGTSTNNSNPSAEPSPDLNLDELNVSFEGSHTVDNIHSGWTGAGFIDYIGEGSANWAVNINVPGEYLVTVRYAFSGGSNRHLRIFVNDEPDETISFTATGSNSQWEEVTGRVELPAGDIIFGLATTGKSGPNIDRVILQKAADVNRVRFDESNVVFHGAHKVVSDSSGHYGVGFVDVVGEGHLDWPLHVQTANTFSMKIRYSLSGLTRPMQLLLNGIVIGHLDFQSTGSFTTWESITIDVDIPAGNHTLRLMTLGSSGPNIDQITLLSSVPTDTETPSELALFFVHNDHLGTPQTVTNTQQQVVWVADYLPFGQLISSTGNAVELYSRFPGQYIDEETGLYYNYFRDYDPSIGRYIESDPIGLEGGINTYLYVDGNPLSGIDPFGLSKYKPKDTVEAWCLKYPTACREQEKHIYDQLRKKKKPNTSGKDGAKDCPSWAKKDGGPIQNEDGKDYAKRLLDEKYGPGNWGKGGGSEYSQIQKWADRSFE